MSKARDLANAGTALTSVSATELGYVDGVTSAIQTQLDAKAPSSTAVTLTGTQTLTNKTLTNPVIASVINNTLTSTTGDIIYASAANTPARLGIGSTGNVLTVAAGIPSWATPGGNVSWSLLSTTSLSGSSVSLTGLTNNNYFVWLQDWTGSSAGQDVRITLNSNTTAGDYDGLYLYPSTFQAQSYRGGIGAFDIGNISGTQAGFAEISSAQQSGYKKIRAWTAKTSGGTEYQGTEGFFKNSSVVSSIQIFVTGGTFSGGTAYLYGGS